MAFLPLAGWLWSWHRCDMTNTTPASTPTLVAQIPAASPADARAHFGALLALAPIAAYLVAMVLAEPAHPSGQLPGGVRRWIRRCLDG